MYFKIRSNIILTGTILIVWFGFFSCSKYSININRTDLNEVEIEILKPAEIILPQNINRVIIAYYDNLANYTIFKQTSRDGRFADTLNHFPIDAIINGLINQINLSQRLKTFSDVIVSIPRNDRNADTWKRIDSLGNLYKSEAMVIIDSINSLFTYTVDKIRIYDENSANICMNNYQSKVRLVLVDIATNKIIDAVTYTNNVFSKTCEIPDEIIQDNFEYIDNFLDEICRKYTEHLSPVWIKSKRKYYGWGNNDMKNAKEFVLKNDWPNAKLIWEKVSVTKDKVLVNHATYNLALAYEMLGNLDKAYEYACKAYMQNQNSITTEYYDILVNRLEDRKILNKQLYYKE